jgi:hypothetical protein
MAVAIATYGKSEGVDTNAFELDDRALIDRNPDASGSTKWRRSGLRDLSDFHRCFRRRFGASRHNFATPKGVDNANPGALLGALMPDARNDRKDL